MKTIKLTHHQYACDTRMGQFYAVYENSGYTIYGPNGETFHVENKWDIHPLVKELEHNEIYRLLGIKQ
ncbi:MAG: hypothetical protein ACREHG_10145 [Candidatus Saccharimonadales bacterium]